MSTEPIISPPHHHHHHHHHQHEGQEQEKQEQEKQLIMAKATTTATTTTTTTTTDGNKAECINTKELVRGRVAGILPGHLDKIEQILKKNKSGFLVGNSPTIADFDFFCLMNFWSKGILDYIDTKKMIKNAPAVKKHWKKILALKTVDTWYKEEKNDGATLPLKKTGLELVYFNIAGRAEAIRLACREGGLAFRDVRVSRDEFIKMKEDGTLPFGQLPCLFIDGVPLAQSVSILRYVAKLSTNSSLYPSDDMAAAQVDSLLALTEDLRSPVGMAIYAERFGYKFDQPNATPASVHNNTKGAVYTRVHSILEADLAKYELLLSKSTSGFIVGDDVTIADFSLFGVALAISKGNYLNPVDTADLMEGAPVFKAHMQKILSLPSVSNWQSEEHAAWDGSDLENKGFELVYFNSPGRAEAIRLACREGSVKFKDVRVNKEYFVKLKSQGILPMGQLPVLFIDGAPLAQSTSILRYVGKRSGLYPFNKIQAAMVDAIIAQTEDTIGKIIFAKSNAKYGWEVDYSNTRMQVRGRVGTGLAGQLEKMDKILEKNKSGFIAGDSLTIADLTLFSAETSLMSGRIDYIDGPALIANAKAVNKHYEKIKSLDFVVDWNKSEHKTDEMQGKGLELVYFDFGGRAEAIRLALKACQISFNDVRISREKFTSWKQEGKFPFGQMPCLFIDGEPLAQSNAILRYVAKLSQDGGNKAPLYPSDSIQAARVDAMLAQVDDLLVPVSVSMFPGRYGWNFDQVLKDKAPIPGFNTRKLVRTRVVPILAAHLAKFEGALKASSTDFLVGDSPTIADIALFTLTQYLKKNMLDHIDCIALLDAVPKIKEHHQKFSNMEKSIPPKEHVSELTNKGLELVYFNVAGRAEAIRIACKLGDVDFADVRIKREAFLKMKADGVLPFGQLPTLFVDGVPLAQSSSILRYVGRASGKLYPTDQLQAAKVDSFLDAMNDMQTPLGVIFHPERHGWKLEK